MLVMQAHVLDAIFGECARRARLNMGEYLQTSELYLRLALKAQSQCRATWETLANIKNPPPVALIRQANIANGPQQVNNAPAGVPAAPLARAGNSTSQSNELLEHSAGQRLDNGTTLAATRADSAMATVGALDGADDK